MAEQQTKATRPLPSLAELDTADFWRATKQKRFDYQQCVNCGTVVWHPRAHCTGCVQGELEWKTSAGLGEIYSYSVIRQSYHPFFRNQVPYVVAYVDLDEGPRLLTNLVNIEDPDRDVHIGQRVELVWEEHEELNIPLVQPADT
jgi:uncharacterized OB-fold protein